MKFAALISAGLIAAAAMAPASASAQVERHHDRRVERTVVHTERNRGWRPHTRTICRVEYRHHQRIRTCRTVRR